MVSTLGADLFCLRAGAGDGTPGPPAGLLILPSKQVEEAGEGGGGMLAASSSRLVFFSRGSFGGWIISNLKRNCDRIVFVTEGTYLTTYID